MNQSHLTPVKELSVEEAFSNLKIKARDDQLPCGGAVLDAGVNLPDDEEGQGVTWGVKRLAGHRTIEGSPLADAFPIKRFDPKDTPLCFKSDAAILSETPVKDPADLKVSLADTPPAVFTVPHKLLVVNTASASLLHDTGDHQENQLRTELIAGPEGCLRRPRLEGIIWQAEEEIAPAALSDILRVHEYSYIAHLESKVKLLTGMHQSGSMPHFYAPNGYLDADTPLSASSLDAAKRFCGGAMLAVDKVLACNSDDASSLSKTAFVIGRPPGHHAGPNGCVPPSCYWHRPDMTSSGFCLLNTVAVAAAHARSRYAICVDSKAGPIGAVIPEHSVHSRPLKIAIVDIDIHHGNGTEEIVRNLTPHNMHLPLPSSWAPVSVPSYKPWYSEQDSDEVLFASIHLYGGPSFYPCSGEETPLTDMSVGPAGPQVINIGLTPIGPGTEKNALSKKAKFRTELTNKQRSDYCAIASAELRNKVTQKLLPKLVNFSPDLLLISSGFDAHYDDMYHYLNEDDFHWLTRSLKETCPRVVSVMEGGYSLKPVLLQGTTEQTTQSQHDRFAILTSQTLNAGGVAASKASRTKLSTQKHAVSGDPDIPASNKNISPDGGLVKAVMAHACALIGRDSWV